MTMIEPSSQAKIAMGPAMWVALNAPNSQPEPMIEPTPANSRPTGPTCRRRPLVASSAAYSTRNPESVSNWNRHGSRTSSRWALIPT